MKHLSYRLIPAALLALLINPLFASAQDEYPKPVTEYTEESGQNTMTFLNYPKYYKNASGKLTEVKTDLVPSSDPAWDYEVSEGIWQLKVKKDGTFQAEHEGDLFTYRFNALGIGRGSQFRKVELGKPNFAEVSVIGDTVRWSSVYPDVDLTVRYIHDILKVDVVVKNAFLRDLKAEAQAGNLDKNDYLTARFDIPRAVIRNQAKQNGIEKDLYAESLEVVQPIAFEKEGKVVHRLRPVRTYRLQEDGEPDYETAVRSAQVMQLKRNEPGVAEMSALIEDLAKLPEGDVVIDPSWDFGFYTGATKDARLGCNQYLNYGGEPIIDLNAFQSLNKDQAVIACDFNDPSYHPLGTDKTVVKVTLNIRTKDHTFNGPVYIKAYNVLTTWNEGLVNWYEPWNSGSGKYASTPAGNASPVYWREWWFPIDLTAPFLARYPSSLPEFLNKGLLLEYSSFPIPPGSYDYMSFYSKDNPDTTKRWNIVVTYFKGAGRTQETVHQPFLTRRNGDKTNQYDRWFPIGWYIQANHATTPWGWQDGSFVGLAYTPFRNLLYNAVVPIPLVDDNIRDSTPIQINPTTTNDFVSMAQTAANILQTNGLDYKVICSVSAGTNFVPDLMTPERPWHIVSAATYAPFPFSWIAERNKVIEVASNNTINNSPHVLGWFLGDEPYQGQGAYDYETHNPAHPPFRNELRDEMIAYKNDIAGVDQARQRPFYINERGNGNYASPTPIPEFIDDLQFHNYTLDSSLYASDVQDNWEAGITNAQYAMNILSPLLMTEGTADGRKQKRLDHMMIHKKLLYLNIVI